MGNVVFSVFWSLTCKKGQKVSMLASADSILIVIFFFFFFFFQYDQSVT